VKTFCFDAGKLRGMYHSQGWAHVRGGITPEFLEHLRDYNAHLARTAVLHGTGIRGAKEQHLYEPPDGVDLVGDLQRMVVAMCGLGSEGFTLAERHLKHYAADADPAPFAHKDRLASQVSVGVSIDVPAGSHLVLYPAVHRDVNPFLTADFRESLGPDALPEVVLRDAPAVEIYDQPGDVVLFPGSSTWHLRRNSANTANLYLKCNDFGSDPMGEDPSTAARRNVTDKLLALPVAELLQRVTPALSRHVEWVGTVRGRDGVDRPAVKIWDRPLAFVSASQLAMVSSMSAASGPRSRRGPAGLGGDGPGVEQGSAEDVVALARLGVVDLLEVVDYSRTVPTSA
jgi:hypothetical protein